MNYILLLIIINQDLLEQKLKKGEFGFHNQIHFKDFSEKEKFILNLWLL
jgi:hypothetical protein